MLYGRGLCLNHPVENVSWDDAKFIEEANKIQGKCVYRLPTEAERIRSPRGNASVSVLVWF